MLNFQGEGSALMSRQAKLEQVVMGMQAVTDLPITAKIRTGIYEDKFIAHNLVQKLRDWGIAMTTVRCTLGSLPHHCQQPG